MTLKEFIELFVCKNTLIRLWIPFEGGHKMLHEKDNDVTMEWEILDKSVWQSNYLNYKVLGVTDIVTDTYKEAVNIVLIDSE